MAKLKLWIYPEARMPVESEGLIQGFFFTLKCFMILVFEDCILGRGVEGQKSIMTWVRLLLRREIADLPNIHQAFCLGFLWPTWMNYPWAAGCLFFVAIFFLFKNLGTKNHTKSSKFMNLESAFTLNHSPPKFTTMEIKRNLVSLHPQPRFQDQHL